MSFVRLDRGHEPGPCYDHCVLVPRAYLTSITAALQARLGLRRFRAMYALAALRDTVADDDDDVSGGDIIEERSSMVQAHSEPPPAPRLLASVLTVAPVAPPAAIAG